MYKLFPKTKFVDHGNPGDQLIHIQSELNELVDAYYSGNREHTIEEAIDLKHSVDTLLHKMGVTEQEHDNKVDYVVLHKNFPREYYKR